MKRAALLLPCLLAVAVGPLAEPPSAELQKRWQANLDAPGWTELRMATRDLYAAAKRGQARTGCGRRGVRNAPDP